MAKIVRKSPVKPTDPRYTAEITHAEIMAAKSMHTGTANESQQRIFMDLVTRKLAQYNDPYFSANPQEMAFYMGRRFVALELMKLIILEIHPDGRSSS